jgi:ATP-dependent Zn protease
MENLRSKRRPIKQQDEVDEAISRMGKRMRYNPITRHWLRVAIIVFIVAGLASTLLPVVSRGGIGGLFGFLFSTALQIMIALLFGIMQFVGIMWFLSRGRTYWLKPGETGVSFNDYKGNPEVLAAAREVVTLLRGARQFKDMGGDVIRGFLLAGPPGTGKSYLAQCISTEAGIPFGYLSAPSLQSMWMGVGSLKVMALYRKARKFAREYGGCIVFVDEIDAVGMSRSAQGGAGGMGGGMAGIFGGGNLLLNELLVQLDPPPVSEKWFDKMLRALGLRKKGVDRPPVLTMAATNLVETLDPALLRPGRFDRRITVEPPDSEGRKDVIEYYLDKVNHENMPIDRMVSDTIGYTPVAIKYVINEGVIRAHFDGRDAMTYRDFLAAIDLYEMGLKQPLRGMSQEERKRIAYHETGHAVAQALLVPWERIAKVSIIRHGNALGFVAPKPKEEKYTLTATEIEVDIQVSLASRAAEEIFLGLKMSGFSGDLASATYRALTYIGLYGMGDHLASMTILQSYGMNGIGQTDVEIFLEKQYKKVKALIEANQEMCHAIAAALLEKHELLGDEVLEIINSYNPVLTEDAQAKRMGFRPIKRGVRQRGGMSTESVPVAANGNGVVIGGSYGEDDGVIYPPAVAFSNTPQANPRPGFTPQSDKFKAEEDGWLPPRW